VTTSISSETKEVLRTLIQEKRPTPTQLMEELQNKLPYRDIRDALALMLDEGEVRMSADRSLSLAA